MARQSISYLDVSDHIKIESTVFTLFKLIECIYDFRKVPGALQPLPEKAGLLAAVGAEQKSDIHFLTYDDAERMDEDILRAHNHARNSGFHTETVISGITNARARAQKMTGEQHVTMDAIAGATNRQIIDLLKSKLDLAVWFWSSKHLRIEAEGQNIWEFSGHFWKGYTIYFE